MMLCWKSVVTAAMVALLTQTGAEAQRLGQGDAPAEVPPASYTGRQYIDSRGCAFVRAGFDGVVSWVPRVTRDKRLICGMKPTFAPGPTAVVEAAPEMPAPPPVARPRAPAPAPAAEGVRVVPAPAARPSAQRVERALASVCPGLGADAGRYMVVVDGLAVRCPAPGAGAAVQPAAVSTASATPVVPKGYRAAWSDGRLNPNRGPRTEAGNVQMARYFDVETVPMVAAEGAPKVVEHTVVGTKSAPRAAAGGHVQAASFSDPGNASAAAARLKAAGLPVAMGRAGGLSVVLAGPFASAQAAQAGLAEVRRNGFGDAFLRR